MGIVCQSKDKSGSIHSNEQKHAHQRQNTFGLFHGIPPEIQMYDSGNYYKGYPVKTQCIILLRL